MSMKANALYIQSGGPTAVINNSAYGVIRECRMQECIENIYASEHGILGVIEGKLFDVTRESAQETLLANTPGMLFGSSRYEINEDDPERKDYKEIKKTLEAFQIRYIFLNGGNGSARAACRLGSYLDSVSYACKLILIPKTVDNDISCIDHAPGFPSAARHVALTTAELADDMQTYDTELIMFAEVMGRNTGFLAAASKVAERISTGPDLIYVPETTFSQKKFIEDVRKTLKKRGKCFAIVAEGVKGSDGKFLFEDSSINRNMDMKKNMGGITQHLSYLLRQNFDCKIRGIDMGLMQRCAAHDASEIDRKEAERLGRYAVKMAVTGKTNVMAAVLRRQGEKYRTKITTVMLSDVVKTDKTISLEYVNENQNGIKESYFDYVMPLIGDLKKHATIEKKHFVIRGR